MQNVKSCRLSQVADYDKRVARAAYVTAHEYARASLRVTE